MERLKGCLSVAAIERTLDTFPSTLDETYEHTFERIQQQAQDKADVGTLALLWVLRAHRRLTIRQLQEAVATCYRDRLGRFVVGEFKEAAIVQWNDIVYAAGGLLVSDEEQEVRFIRK